MVFYFQADATLDMEERELCQASMQYVFRLQELEELKKFEFVETVSKGMCLQVVVGVRVWSMAMCLRREKFLSGSLSLFDYTRPVFLGRHLTPLK